MRADLRDPFPRRTATAASLAPWLGEIVATVPFASRITRGGRGLDPRTRERVMVAVSETNGCRYCTWIHGEWRDFLGPGGTEVERAEEAVELYARACAEAGRPLDTKGLDDVLSPRAIGALRATVAQIEVSSLVGNTVDGLIARATRKRPLAPFRAVQEAAVVGLALPVAVPSLATAGVMRLVNRLAPSFPDIEMPEPGKANLLVHLLAQALPTYLSNAAVRLAVVGLPVSVAIGLRAGRTAATLVVGRGRVEIRNGISRDAWVVVEGEVEPLLELASGELVREIGTIRVRPNP